MQNAKCEAPVFRPSKAAFEDPFAYIESIRALAEPFGICRIIPPPSWKPPFALDLTRFKFPTRVQSIHQLYKRDASEEAQDTWWENYVAFQLAENKKQRTRNPILGGKELELRRLFHVVEKRGGYHNVCKQKLWKDVARCLQVHLSNGNTTYSLRNVYEKYLKDFEERQGQVNAPLIVRNDSGAIEQPIAKKQKHDNRNESPPRRRRRSSRRVPSNLEALLCEHCKGGQFESCIILCDNCPSNRTKGYHTFCCSPARDRIPDGNFYCPECSATLFGRECFTTGPDTTYDEFTSYAEDFESNYDTSTSSHEELEKDFWRIVENGDEVIDVLYGADIPTGTYGSGFPIKPDDLYSAHPMNLNNLPRASGSLLSLVAEDIPGVIVPWLYMGMKYTAFCWHVEDHLFYSVNYLHKGAGKKWYGISSDQADEFESLLRMTILKDQLREQPDLLFHITTMVAPERLREHGIQVCETLQEEGEFVITFPMAYHSGFNLGLNIAEAVNFAPLHWLKFRRKASSRYITHRRHQVTYQTRKQQLLPLSQVLSVEELILKAAMREDGSFRGEELHEEMHRLAKEEEINRLALWNQGVVKSMKISSSHGLKAGDNEDICCVICCDYLHVSAVVCSCCHRPVCIRHVNQQCECPMSSRTLLYRFTLAELFDIRNQSLKEGTASAELEQKTAGIKREARSQMCENQHDAKFQAFLDQWLVQAERVVPSCEASTSEMDTLLYEAMQFLWAGHEVDRHRVICARLKDSIEWYNGLERLTQPGETKVTVEELKDMISKTPHHSNHPGVQKLKEMRKEVQDWILGTEGVLHPEEDLELHTLFSFHEKGRKMNVILPGLNLINERVADASALQKAVSSVFDTTEKTRSHDLDVLRMLSQRAKQLKIVFPERQRLDHFLSIVSEWCVRARARENESSTLEDLRSFVAEVDSVAANIPELIATRQRLQHAEQWNENATKAMQECTSITEMQELLSQGRSLNVIFPEMPTYEQKLAQLEWKQTVDMELQKPTLTLPMLEQFIARGVECRAEHADLFAELSKRKDTAEVYRSKSRDLMAKVKGTDAEKIPYQVIQELVEDPAASAVFLSEVQECKELFQSIQPIACVIEQTMSAMQTGQSLKSWEVSPFVSQAENLSVSFIHLPELKHRIQLAESFSNKAKHLLTMGLRLSHLPELKQFLHLGEAFVEEHGFRIAEMDILLEWDTRLRLEWLMHRLLCDPVDEDSEVIELGLPLDTVPFSPLEILKHRFSESVQKQKTDPAPNRQERPQLDAVSAVLEQAKCVNANFQLISRLERAYAGGLKWTEYMQETVNGTRKLGSVEIVNLLQLGKDHAFKLEGIDRLEGILAAYSQWTEDVQRTLSALEKGRLPLEDVQKLLHEIQRSSVIPEGEAVEKLKKVVQPAQDLRESLQRELHGSLDALYVVVQKVASVSQLRDWKHSGFNGCYCGQVQGLDPLLTCAKCSHWYHTACIPTVTKSSRRWMCSPCKNSVQKSDAPSHAALQEHLSAYRLLNLALAEERMLEATLYHFQTWHRRVDEMLRLHDEGQTSGQEGTLDVSELSCIWKQSLVIGIQCKETTERAIRAMKVTQCRSLIQEHLQETGLTAFDIPRCRKEEIPLHIIDKKPQAEIVQTFVENSVHDPDRNDPLLQSAKEALTQVYGWEGKCRELTALLDRHAGEPIEQVPKELLRRTSAHVDKATTMRVRVNRDYLEHLIFQSTPYCICRQTNDSERPMLACEEEEDCPILWFHHRCVGLNESDAPPPGYRCPHCSMRKGLPYPYELPKGSELELARQYHTNGPSHPQTTSLPVTTNGAPPGESSDPSQQIKMHGVDVVALFSDVASRWNQWSDIERLRVLEHVGECVREESRRIHEKQQQQQRSVPYRS